MRGAEGVPTSSSSGGGSEDLYEILGEKRAASKARASGDTTMEETETEQQARRQEEEEEEESADDNPSRRPSRDVKEELAGFGIPQRSRAAPTPTPAQARTSASNPTSQPQVEARSSAKKNLTSRLVNPNVRERKFGVMRRVFQVPGTTEVRVLFHNVVFLSPPPTFAHSLFALSSPFVSLSLWM